MFPRHLSNKPKFGSYARSVRTARLIDVNEDGVLDAGDTEITVYGWDVRNRLTSVTTYATLGGDPTQVVHYLYDAENRWVGESIDADGDGSVDRQIRFAYDGNQIVLQFDKTGSSAVTGANLSHRYLWAAAVGQVLADEQLLPSPNGRGAGGEGGEGQGEGSLTAGGLLPAAGSVVWPLADHLGTVRDLAVFDTQTGVTSVANHRVYDSFGNLLSQTNAAVDSLFGFTGLPFDQASGTYRSQTRPYDPATGQWLQPDWIGFHGRDTNLYRYVGNSVTMFVDRTGQWVWPWDPNAQLWVRMPSWDHYCWYFWHPSEMNTPGLRYGQYGAYGMIAVGSGGLAIKGVGVAGAAVAARGAAAATAARIAALEASLATAVKTRDWWGTQIGHLTGQALKVAEHRIAELDREIAWLTQLLNQLRGG